MPEIQSLSGRIQELDRAVNFWNTAMIWSLVFTALAAIAVVVTTRIGLQRAKQLADVQAELTRAKESQLALDLKDKDIKIAGAEERAAEANRKAEEERLRRVELQRSVLHRMIPQIGVGDKMNYDSLKPFKGVNVILRYAPEREPGMFSGNLAAIVQNAGWNFLGQQPAKKNEIVEGVTVEGDSDFSMKAAKSLVEFLKISGIDGARLTAAKPGSASKDTVEILIGPMPDPFK